MKRNQLRKHLHTELNPSHILRYKSASDIIGSLRNYILTHTDELNDFTTGSALETLLEAIATELEMYYHLSTQNIKGSIDTAATSAFNISMRPQRKASGVFIVHFNEPLENALQIPSGTQFSSSKDSYNQIYRTIQAYNAPAGSTNFAVTAYCTTPGTYGNIPAEIIDRCDNFPEADSIVNPTSISNGQNNTTLPELKVRFRNMIQALQRGTVQAVQYGAMEVPGITGAFVDESVGYVRVYCHDANGDLPRYLQKRVQENMVNWRPAGIPVEVLPVHKSIVEVGITLDVPNRTLRTAGLLGEVKNKITNYINTRQASQDLVLNHIVSIVMSLSNLGIDNVQVDMYVVPSQALVQNASVNSHDNILLNEHIFNKDILAPKDRAEFDDYVHTPGMRDNPPYATNAHGDGYITADIDNDTEDNNGDIDNNLDSNVISPVNISAPDLLADAYQPLMNSMSSAASEENVNFDSDSASNAIQSMMNTSSGITAAENAVVGSLENSLSGIDAVNGISYNAESASSYANSYIGRYSTTASSYSNSVASSASNNSSVISSTMASLSALDSLNSLSYNASSAKSYAIASLKANAGLSPDSAAGVNAYYNSEFTTPSSQSVAQNNAQVAAAVSAGDARPNKPMRILNRYNTRGNEILRAGNIVVNYNMINQFNRE